MTDQWNLFVQSLEVLPARLRNANGPDEAAVTLRVTPQPMPGDPPITLVNVNIRGVDQIQALALSLLEVAEQAQRAVEQE